MGDHPSAIDTNGWIMPSGKHKGIPIRRVPIGYLLWMVRTGHDLAYMAQAEIERRGTKTPDVEVSAHAIDRASLLLTDYWPRLSRDDEGLYTWLARMTVEAIQHGRKDRSGKIIYQGMKLAIGDDGAWPVLVTIMPERRE